MEVIKRLPPKDVSDAKEDPIQIVCPPVVYPGTFFNCRIDIPSGQDLVATITMVDDLTLFEDANTGPMPVPGTLTLFG